ncbi:bacteriorhodopsin [Jannaschia formosa]|uniref:bacteriorhodopsin n=1 Tax=Jannaschia formosa TaxID=2259592 RepID=UPI000E1B6A4E|nr:bacteriorhodopsin [Jannaschia formosa]TFL17402.1 rhodopsin [Jannaschia formosa]
MINYENFFTYAYWEYEVIRHMFSFTAAVFAASLFYFAMTVGQAAAKYRTTFVISGVVMVSATLELFLLWLMWNRAFTFDAATMTFSIAEGQVFSNGYRYANWLIDVPMLLTQFLIVLQFAGAELRSRWVKLAGAGALMIVLGYVGQYYEPQVAGFAEGSGAPFWIWGGLSWLVFFYLLYAANEAVGTGKARLEPRAAGLMQNAWILLIVTWFIYGFAYMIPGIPGINDSSTWVVFRQGIFTFADVCSKAVFGILLSQVALEQSRTEEGGSGQRRAA